MGLIKASILTLLIAVSIPLAYRHFVDDKALKTLNSYHPNFKNVDRFLRQSASQIDTAREYLPTKKEVQERVDVLMKQAISLYEDIKSNVAKSDSKKSEPVKKSTVAPSVTTKAPVGSAPKASQASKWCTCSKEGLQDKKVKLWSKDELSKFDGSDPKKGVHLAFLGTVYDVTSNVQHYGKGAEYNIFAGKDATRGFVTGNFALDLHDNIDGIDEAAYGQLESWKSFYKNNYPVIGRLEGHFYDSQCCSTPALVKVEQQLNALEQQKKNEQISDKQFPECNSEWNSQTESGKVWCTTKSGGVERTWTGVPRIFNDGKQKRCACFNQDLPGAQDAAKFMSTYPKCDPKAVECKLTSN